MERSAVKDKILTVCLGQLKAIVCKFAIIDYAEETHGELIPLLKVVEDKRTVNRRRWDSVKPEMHAILANMSCGDVHVFNCPVNEDIDAYHSLICNSARNAWGGTLHSRENPAYTTCTNKEQTAVELLRLY